MEILLTVILWILMGGATSYLANQRGRDPFAWFLIGMLLGLLGLLLLYLLPALENTEDEKEEEFEVEGLAELIPPSPTENYRFKDWFYLDDRNQQLGPLSFQSFKKIWLQGKISDHTFVWSEGMENWRKVQDLPGFKEVLS